MSRCQINWPSLERNAKMAEAVVAATSQPLSQTSGAASGHEALGLLQQERNFDLLMIDLLMPKMDGTTFAAEARRLAPGVPVLFITGYNGTSDAQKISEAQYLIKKPFRLAELAEQLRNILR